MLTVTKDHLVWIEGKEKPIRLLMRPPARHISYDPELMGKQYGWVKKISQEKRWGKGWTHPRVLTQCVGCGQKIERREIAGGNYRRSKTSCKRETQKLAVNRGKVRVYHILNSGPNNRFTVSGCLVHNCGYGGSVGALKAMGALEMGLMEAELKPLVDTWRAANPNITKFWWDVDRAALTAVRNRTTTETHGIVFEFRSGMLFVHLPSDRHLSYVKHKIWLNQFGRDCNL